MSNCDNYDDCIRTTRRTLKHPIDRNSLYRNRIYDNQTARRRCFELSPINILEGFGGGGLTVNNLLKWAIILLIVYLVYMAFTKSDAGKAIMKGGSESLSDLSFLKTE